MNNLMNLKLIFVVTLLSSDQEFKKDVGRKNAYGTHLYCFV